MRTAIFWLLAVLATIGFCNGSNAAPLTAYYDQASWDAAVAGLTIGPYTGTATLTDYRTTIGFGTTSVCPHPGLCVFGTAANVQTGPGLFDHVRADFTVNSICQPMCTSTSEMILALDQPIMGFAADDFSCNFFTDLRVNGLDYSFPVCAGPRFFGLVGPISTLDFTGTLYSDNPTIFDLRNIVVATIPEPFTLSLFGIGLAGAISLRKRSAAKMEPKPHGNGKA